ncbi:vanadium-dependent haloperoxidase [Streptomyces sp. NPDC088789]|uniref:vanadium-dependent haloperoxidase n=1 Tax=Streptomyces sp. NPDC088789 TaxID=3365899 RepID=UPI003820E749
MSQPGPRPTRRTVVALGATAVLGTLAGTPQAAAATPATRASSTDTVLTWYDATAATLAAAGATTQVTNSRTWAIGWLAAARAARGVPGGTDRAAFRAAAVAAALHHTLVTVAPTRAEHLDATLRQTLAALPPGDSTDAGLAAGRREAARVLDSRQGDGLDPATVNAPYPVPAPAPGRWQPTPPAYGPAVQYGNRLARPFLLTSPSHFRLGPPPALDSRQYATDLAEVRAYGALDSTVRTAHQTETANFWYGSSLTLYTEPLRVALDRSGQDTAERALSVALFHIALVDTQIATSDTKYAYERWRPVTAIRTGVIAPDPAWTPLHTTPSHPDYPSGHNTYSGAAEAVLANRFGARTAPFPLTSPTAPGVTRTYTTWKRLSDENVGARIFSGIHTRSADEAGIRLGKRVGRYTLEHIGDLL